MTILPPNQSRRKSTPPQRLTDATLFVTARYAETARLVLLVTCGTMLRLWAPSYPAALGRLARRGRIAAARGREERGAA